jgi:hypothetical protein
MTSVQKFRTPNQKPGTDALLRSPFKRIAIDIAGPFPESKRGNWHLLIATDYFTN